MTVVSITDKIETRKDVAWWHQVTNILRVLSVFKKECDNISDMIEARGDPDELCDNVVYDGIDEYFCSEPVYIEASELDLKSNINDISTGKYVFILEISEDIDLNKTGKLFYMKKVIGETL